MWLGVRVFLVARLPRVAVFSYKKMAKRGSASMWDGCPAEAPLVWLPVHCVSGAVTRLRAPPPPTAASFPLASAAWPREWGAKQNLPATAQGQFPLSSPQESQQMWEPRKFQGRPRPLVLLSKPVLSGRAPLCRVGSSRDVFWPSCLGE